MCKALGRVLVHLWGVLVETGEAEVAAGSSQRRAKGYRVGSGGLEQEGTKVSYFSKKRHWSLASNTCLKQL